MLILNLDKNRIYLYKKRLSYYSFKNILDFRKTKNISPLLVGVYNKLSKNSMKRFIIYR